MIRLPRALLAAALVGTTVVGVTHASAAPSLCPFGGPAGTAAVTEFVVPAATTPIDLRVTTSTSLTARTSDLFGGRSAWHLVTGIAVVRVSDLRIVASRFVQSGSSPRRVAISAAGQDIRADLSAPGATFAHTGGRVPPQIKAGRYYAVAFGADGSDAQPNAWWSAEMRLGSSVTCAPVQGFVRVFDHDGSDFRGGTQVSGYGAGYASGTTLQMHPHAPLVLGVIDAEDQGVGSVQVGYRLPHRQGGVVKNAMASFAGRAGLYRFQSQYVGLFPVALVSGVVFGGPAR